MSISFLRRFLILAAITLGYAYFAWSNGLFLRWDYTYNLYSLVLLGGLASLYIFIRRRVGLPRTGLELPILGCLIVILGTIAFSPDPRLGLERYTLLLNLVLLLYFLMDAFGAGLSFGSVFGPIMLISGLIAAAAAAEAYAWYLGRSGVADGAAFDPANIYRVLTLIGHSNAYMGYMNLVAPLVAVYAFSTKTRLAVFSSLLWMAFFLITIPFTSSRGGLMGLAGWVGVLIVLWAWDRKIWRGVLAWSWGKKGLLIGLGLALGFMIIGGGYLALSWFAQNPTHGGDVAIFSGREGLWATAQAIWLKSPWVGGGLGHYAFDYALTTRAYPPGFLALHAHSTVLNILAETGLLGFLGMLLPAGLFLWKLWSAYRNLPPAKKMWGAAILAGLASGMVYAITESALDNPYLVTGVIIFGAWLMAQGGLQRMKAGFLTMPVLSLPLLASVAILALTLWGYRPFTAGVQAYESGDKQAGLELLRAAEQADPGMAFYQLQVGLALADHWGESGNPADLQEARFQLATFLGRDSSFSLWWADLAVLDWYAGDRTSALTHMQRAVEMAPNEATYPLNLGWFEEQVGETAKAAADYKKTLALVPEWSCHPFWSATSLRQSVVSDVDCSRPWDWVESAPNLKRAAVFLGSGDLAQAEAALEAGRGEWEPALRTVQAAYYTAMGDSVRATQAREDLLTVLLRPTLREWQEASAVYAAPYKRVSISIEIVPGYLKLMPDVGQFAELERQAEEEERSGKIEEAAQVRLVLARLSLGSAIAQ